jgi:preprotein translocase subunit SecE
MAKDTQLGSLEWARTGRQFMTEVRAEFRKVTWPTRKETVGGTVGVLVVVAVITTVLGVVDFALAELVHLVIP